MRRFRLPLDACLLGVALFVLSCGWGAAAAGPPQQDGSVFLEVQVSLIGHGSDPYLVETANALQNWNYERVVSGFLELAATTTSVGEGPDQRELITYVPKLGGKAALTGRAKDTVSHEYREFGEGGSWVDYRAKEEWNWELFEFPAQVGDEESDLRFVFDPKDSTWRVTCELETWLDLLAQAARKIYYGEATFKPGAPGAGAGGGSSSGWSHFTIKEEDRSQGEKFITTGYHPGGFNSLLFVPRIEFLGVASTNTGTAYSGQAMTDVAPPDSARGIWKMDLALQWTIRDKLPDVELVLGPDKNREYLDWRPSVEPGKDTGRPLRLRAQLKSPAGEDLSRIRVEKFTWRLSDTSREPGNAMNFPVNGAGTAFDLQLTGYATGSGTVSFLDNERQALELRKPDGLFSVIGVIPHDWGGWSVLRVEAELQDGRVIKGELDPALSAGGPLDEIRIPRSHPDSKISASWVEEKGALSQSDDEDSDEAPEGKPGVDGDGLSLYEEYRGFFVGGKHTSTDPHKKDLFVLNEVEGLDVGEITKRALNRFKAISGLEVHKVNVHERFNGNRVNLNRSRGPTRGPQAGLWLRETGAFPRPNDLIKAGARPGKVDAIRVPRMSSSIGAAAPLFAGRGPGPSLATGLEHMILQALFQCVGVDRPGPSDKVVRFYLDLTGDRPTFSTPFEGPVLVIDFFGRDLARDIAEIANKDIEREAEPYEGESPAATQQRVNRYKSVYYNWDWLVGTKGGAHSGPENCLMRDWFADVYKSRLPSVDGRPVYRLIDPKLGAERPGTRLGSTRQGTGVNDPNRKPEPRYGDSGVIEPANKQMVVSDHK